MSQRPTVPDHLCPPHSFLQLHQPLFVLVPFHQHSGHLHPGEALPLGCGHITLWQHTIKPTHDHAEMHLSPHKPDEHVMCMFMFRVQNTHVFFIFRFLFHVLHLQSHSGKERSLSCGYVLLLFFIFATAVRNVSLLWLLTNFLSSSSSSLFLSSSLVLACSTASSSPCSISFSHVNSSSFSIKSLFTTFRAFLQRQERGHFSILVYLHLPNWYQLPILASHTYLQIGVCV